MEIGGSELPKTDLQPPLKCTMIPWFSKVTWG